MAPQAPVSYDDVEVLDDDGLGFTCRIGNERVFVGKYVPIEGTVIRRKGDRGRLMLPRWFVEQQGLPLNRHMSDREVEEWLAAIRLKAAAAQDYAEAHPEDPDARIALERALNELSAAMLLRARRQGEPR
jgi:hypothetical protein